MTPDRTGDPLVILGRLRRRFIRETEYFLNRRLGPLHESKPPRIGTAARR
jgi:hypothetical protein